jgi:membrane-bound metal-dependent hydrolase YbcI (DUF457 family)
MFATTHIALPVIAAQALNLSSVARSDKSLFNRWQFTTIGICGILPDIVNPHLDLWARYSSWSHSAWFFLGYLLISLAATRFLPKQHRLAIHLGCFAVFLHILCDLISGGVNLLPPYSTVVGDYWIAPAAWLYSDLLCIITVYTLSVITRNKLKRRTYNKDITQ